MNDIWISERAVLQCQAAVEGSIKELLATADRMQSELGHLTGICSGDQFDAIKAEVEKNVRALHAQVADLRSRVLAKLNDVLDWVRTGKTSM